MKQSAQARAESRVLSAAALCCAEPVLKPTMAEQLAQLALNRTLEAVIYAASIQECTPHSWAACST